MYILRAVHNPDKILNKHILRAQAWLANDRTLLSSLCVCFPASPFRAAFSIECTYKSGPNYSSQREKSVPELNWVFLWWATSSLYHLITSATTRTKNLFTKDIYRSMIFLCRYKRAHLRPLIFAEVRDFHHCCCCCCRYCYSSYPLVHRFGLTMDHPPVKSSLCDARNIINLLDFAMKRDNKAHTHILLCHKKRAEIDASDRRTQ